MNKFLEDELAIILRQELIAEFEREGIPYCDDQITLAALKELKDNAALKES